MLRAVTSAAARQYVRIGMTVPEARARCAALIVLPWSDAVVARELARASAAFLAASPQVTPARDAPGTWWIGATGFDALGGERLLALSLLRIARVWHPEARVGVADSCVAARAATWSVGASLAASRARSGVASIAPPSPSTGASEGALTARANDGATPVPHRVAYAEARVTPVMPAAARHETPRDARERYDTGVTHASARAEAAREGPVSGFERRPQDRAAVREPRETGYGARPSGGEPRIVPPGTCAVYLANAPLALVPMDDELRDALISLGLRTGGALAALDAGDVERRWGSTGVAAWRLARGDDARRPVLARTDGARIVTTELAMSAETMEPVLFLVRAALGQLVTALVRDGRAAAAIAITLTLDDGRGATPGALAHTVTREARPARPLARVAPLFERCRALLDTWTLTAPVCAVSVAVSATAPLAAEQGDLLAASWRDPDAADAAFERLRSALGAGTVVRPVARDEHRPEKAGTWAELLTDDAAPAASRATTAGGARAAERGDDGYGALEHETPEATSMLALARLLEKPERVDVETARGAPRSAWWRGQRIAIADARGPERVSGDWWKEPFAREYWRCASDEMAREFLLYRDASGWALQGWFD